MERQAKIVSIINWKGGVGKTTLTHHLATGLQHLSSDELELVGHEHSQPKVLLVDADAQCNLSILCLTPEEFENLAYHNKPPIGTLKDLIEHYLKNEHPQVDVNDFILKAHVRSGNGKVYEHIDLLPAHSELIHTDMDIAVYLRPNFKEHLFGWDIYKFQMLHHILNTVKHEYDFIFIDCPPNLNYITQNALYASDYYLIPAIPDRLSSYGISSIKNKVDELNERFHSSSKEYSDTKLIGIVFNFIREYGSQPKQTQANMINMLKDTLPPDVMFNSYLTYGDAITRASTLSYPVFAVENSQAKQSECVKNITLEFLNRMGGGIVV
ncbi:ParA family protein [Thermolongibacillus altinsuensis]|jgi:chromosome partitioning protein|uniref:ParA family protein n=1 Tax=Thermolongibacillus altinsuensis TaxID=575256 RepID=UPI00242A2BE1|nr:ParA family protein [Thermolongibacillus altinsuensis]GMB08102.1 cobyrinic acid a,c-diamide synthase [Thermolongibacillus altinsuensis]